MFLLFALWPYLVLRVPCTKVAETTGSDWSWGPPAGEAKCGGSSPTDWIGSPQLCFLLMEKNHDWQKTL
jgi:hypothetical protein